MQFLKARKAAIGPWYFRILCEFLCPVLVSALINIECDYKDEGMFVQTSLLASYLSLFIFVSTSAQIAFVLIEEFRSEYVSGLTPAGQEELKNKFYLCLK